MRLIDTLDLTIRNSIPEKYEIFHLDFSGPNGTQPTEIAHNYSLGVVNGELQNSRFVSSGNNGVIFLTIQNLPFELKMGNNWQLDIVYEGVIPEFLIGVESSFLYAFISHKYEDGYGEIKYAYDGTAYQGNTTISTSTTGINYLRIANVQGNISIYVNGSRVSQYDTSNVYNPYFENTMMIGKFTLANNNPCDVLGFRFYKGIAETFNAATCSIPSLPL